MGSSKKQTVGYKFMLGMHKIFCHGPIDQFTRIKVDGKTAWQGRKKGGQINIRAENLFGGEDREGGVSGLVDLELGGPTQGANDYLQSMLGAAIPAFRGVAGAVLRQCYLGTSPYLKSWSARVQRIHVRQAEGLPQWYPAKAQIGSLWEQAQAICISLDVSGSMSEVMPNGQTRLANAQAAVAAALDYIEELRADNGVRLDIMGVTWASSRAANTYMNADTSDIQSLKAFFASATALGSTDFREGVAPVTAFFAAAPDDALRTMIFITDGVPGVTGQDPTDIAEQAAAVLDGIDELWTFGINIDLEDTQYTALLDNTPDDGVPVISGNEPDALLAALKVALGGQADMNPAHIIRECDTDPDWGMGYPEADIDDDAFSAAADQLYQEGFGLSIVWDRQGPIEEFRDEIIRHIDAVHYVDRTTGKFVLKLVRGDYNMDDLLVLDESNIERIENFSRPMPDELVNTVTVRYWDATTGTDAAVSVDDPALVQMHGRVIGQTTSYPGITKHALAARVALRDLRGLSQPLAACTVYANREAAHLTPGSVFKLVWPDLDVAGLAMRVTGIAFGDGKSRRVRIQCVEDVFALPEAAVVAPPPVAPPSSSTPVAAEHRVVLEAPYFELVQRLGQAQADALLDGNQYAGFLLATAARPVGAVNAMLMVDAGGGYENAGLVDFSPVAFLGADVGPMETVFPITDADGLSEIGIGSHAQVGQELVRIDAVSASELTVGRGVLDTVPTSHLAGDIVVAWDAFAEGDQVEYASGEEIVIKLLPVTGAGSIALASAPADVVAMDQRAVRPYPPANVQINEEYFPETVALRPGTGDVSVSFATRNRLQQTGGELVDFEAGDITPEEGTTYGLELLARPLLTTIYSQSGISSSPVAFVPDFGGDVRMRLWAIRDGHESFQKFEHDFFLDVSAPPIPQDISLITAGSAPNIVLSNSNRTMTVGPNATAAWHKAKGNVAKLPSAEGKYFEVVIDTIGSAGSIAMGIAVSGTSVSSATGGTNNAGSGGRYQFFATGQKRADGVYANYGPALSVGDVVGCSVKISGANTSVHFYRNGVDLGEAFSISGTSGNWDPHFCMYANTSAETNALTVAETISYLPDGMFPWALD